MALTEERGSKTAGHKGLEKIELESAVCDDGDEPSEFENPSRRTTKSKSGGCMR